MSRNPASPLGNRGGLPFPAGTTTSLGAYNMLSSSSKSRRSAEGPDRLAQWLNSMLIWFRARPLLALTAFIGVLLFGSILLPFAILNTFSHGGHLPVASTSANSGVSAPVMLTSSRGSQDAFRAHLQAVLGVRQSQLSPELAQLAEHNAEYAAEHPTTAQEPEQAQGGAVAAPTSDAVPAIDYAQPERAAAVVASFKHAYNAYERRCFGRDELHPLSQTCSDWIGAGLTIVDALSTMLVMGPELAPEVERAREWIAKEQRFDKMSVGVSFFETVIRVLGGLISAHDLTGGQGADAVYLRQAIDLANRMMPAFNTPQRLPTSQVNLVTGQTGQYGWTGGANLLAEIATIQMEFSALSERTGDPKYGAAAQKPIDLLDRLNPPDGLYPIYINPNQGTFQPSKITLGAMGDSAYEYFMKMWLLTGRRSEQLARMYRRSMDGVLSKLLQVTPASSGGHSYLADLEGGRLERKMDHLVCFVPGMLALGVSEGIVGPTDSVEAQRHMAAAKELMRTCYDSYARSPSGVGPEVMLFTPGLSVGEPSFKLRPEMVESLFLLWRLTREEQYREWAWKSFQAMERHTRVASGGHAELRDVRRPEGRADKMESFWLAETLKYLYLIFENDDKLILSGNKKPGEYFVLNTECHPIKSWLDETRK